MEPLNDSKVCNDFTIDFTDEETAKQVSFKQNEILLSSVGVPFVLVIGVPANIGLLFTLYRVRRMRTMTNFYLANLAVADLLYIVIFSAYNTWTYLATPIAYSSFATSWLTCTAIALSLDIPYFASNSMITLVALERFYGICYPLKNLMDRGRRRSISIVLIFWTGSVAIAFTISSRLSTYRVACVLWPDDKLYSSLPSTVNFCVAGQPWVRILTQSLYFGFWILGLSVNTFVYYKIIRRLGRRHIPTSSSSLQTHQLHAKVIRNQVARMLIVTSIVYFLLQSPRVVVFNMMGLIQAASGISVLQPGEVTTLWPIAAFLALLNSAFNPIIYNFTNPQYRQAFRRAFGCAVEKNKNVRTASTATAQDGTINITHSENKL